MDGKLQGKVSTNGTLVVGERACLETDIEAGTLIVHGEILGNIVASQRIELHATCRLYGNLQTPSLLVEEGAMLKGQCEVLRHVSS